MGKLLSLYRTSQASSDYTNTIQRVRYHSVPPPCLRDTDLTSSIYCLAYLDIASFQGQKLMLRTEYRAGNESTASMLYAKRSRNEKEDLKQNGILFGTFFHFHLTYNFLKADGFYSTRSPGGVDGTLSTIVPVREIVFKRLQLLQTALTRHVQHFGGLNPRAYRSVARYSPLPLIESMLIPFRFFSQDGEERLCFSSNHKGYPRRRTAGRV